MSNTNDIVLDTFGGLRANAQTASTADIESSPDDAQRAIELSKATGVHPTTILGDLDSFEKSHKATLASDIVKNNSYISDYIASSPMASKISNDDYGQLDTVSQRMTQMYPDGLKWIGAPSAIGGTVMSKAIEGFKAGFGEDGVGGWMMNNEASREFVNKNRLSAATLSVLASPVELTLRSLSGAIKAATDAAVGGTEELAKQLGADPMQAQRMGREVGGIVEMATAAPQHYLPTVSPESVMKARETMMKAKPWVDAGVEPPVGIDPLFDKLHKDQSDVDLKNLDEALKESAKSSTRERSPEMFANYIRQHTDAKIGISAEAVQKLYGDKLPEVDDGKLGWVPRLKEQMDSALATGGDIEIPIADWLARVEPELAKELHDDIRVRAGGITKNEVKLEAEAKAMVEAYHGSPHDFEAFSMEKIGTGEGAQSYGHGLYFAENPDVAKSYELAGQPAARAARRTGNLNALAGGTTADLPKPEGNRYRVRINADKEQFLDWDKPLSEQSPHVQNALDFIEDIEKHKLPDTATGGDLHYAIANFAFDPKTGTRMKMGWGHENASKMLREAGIPGIKYLDQGSRFKDVKGLTEDLKKAEQALKEWDTQKNRDTWASGSKSFDEFINTYKDEVAHLKEQIAKNKQQTHNFVLFDESLIEITHKNGEAVESVRKASAMAPLFEERERKLTLKRSEDPNKKPEFGAQLAARVFHPDDATIPFELLDQEGKSVGSLYVAQENGGKRLYIDDIEGLDRKASANAFGPRAMRDLLKQLKTEFPIAEELTGYRVSGARDKAGSWEKTGKVTIKLSEEADIEAMHNFLFNDAKEDIGGSVKLAVKPTSFFTEHEKLLTEKVQSILSRIVPEFEGRMAQRVEMAGREVAGAYVSPKDAMPIIAVSLSAKDAGKTARHEAIHALRDYGFFTDGEWKAIEDAAVEGNWLKKHNIEERYKTHKLDQNALLEEAISEEFGEWGSQTEAPRKHLNAAVQAGFEKLAAFFKEVLQAIKEVFGHTPTIDELFEKIESGEVGRRAMGASEGDVAKTKGSVKEPELPQSGTTRMEDRQPFTGSFPGWMTIKQRERYMQLIEERNASDVAALEKKIQEQLERERSKEWKANKEAVRAEVESGIADRPDIAADRYLSTGELYGEKGPKPKINPEGLDEAQRKALPPEFLGPDGLAADDLAGLFGYPSGKALVDAVGKLTKERTDAGMTPRAYLKRLTDIETERLMQERYGETPAEVLEAAKDHVLSQTQMDLLHEQTYALATKAGLEFSLTKDQLKQAVRTAFGETPLDSISSTKFLADAGRAGRQMEAAFLKDDAAEAFRQSQRQYLAGLMAREAVKLEKEIARFDKVAKRFSRREVSGVDQPFTNFIHQLLLQSERSVRRSIQDIDASIAQDGYTSLDHFVEDKVADGWELDVADHLQADGAKPMESMSANEFRDFRDAITSLAHVGRAVKQILVAGEKMDFAEWKKGVLDNIKTLPTRTKEKQGKLIYGWDSELTRMEEIVKDLDLRREIGPLFNALIRPMMDGKHKEYQMQEALSKTLKEMKQGSKEWQKTLGDSIPNEHFLDPDTGIPFDLTREHMINIMLNFGNRSNIDKFTKGWVGKEAAPALEAKLREMFDRNANKEDWDFVQKMGDIFEGWRKDTDILYHNLSGLAPKWIQPEPVKTPHGDYKGWYFPIIYDKYHSSVEVIKERPKGNVFGQDYFRATTANRHTRERTGYIDRVEFQNSIDQVASRMQQMIHDISYRAPVMQARKVIYDRQIREAIRKHYGQEYEKQLDPWLKDIANHFNQNEQAISNFNSVLRRARMNLSAHALGLNLKVIGSPDVGSLNPMAVARVLNNYDASVALAWEKSKEIPHSYRNMDRDFRERLENTIAKSGWTNAQATAVRWAFIPLVKVSQGFRIVTFVDQYKKNLAKGLNELDAADAADSQVRLRHGATGVPDLPAIMRGNEGMKMATMFYGFFNAMYNWQRGIKGDMKGKEWSSALERTYGAVVIPALFGALLFNRQEKDEPWGKTMAKGLGLQLLGTVPLARDLGSTMIEGIRPSSPIGSLFQSMASAYTDAKRATQGKPVQKPITHAANVVGLGLGLPLAQIGRTGQFAADVHSGKQRPKNVFEWYRGIVHGEMKPK